MTKDSASARISSALGMAIIAFAAASVDSNNRPSLELFRKTSSRESTQWTARRIASASESGSYQLNFGPESACQRRRAELIVPARARLLFAAAQLSPQLGDWLVKKMT